MKSFSVTAILLTIVVVFFASKHFGYRVGQMALLEDCHYTNQFYVYRYTDKGWIADRFYCTRVKSQ